MSEPEFLRVRNIVEYDRNQVLVMETETKVQFWYPRFNFGTHIGAKFVYLFEFFCTFSYVFTLLSVLKSLKLKKIK